MMMSHVFRIEQTAIKKAKDTVILT